MDAHQVPATLRVRKPPGIIRSLFPVRAPPLVTRSVGEGAVGDNLHPLKGQTG